MPWRPHARSLSRLLLLAVLLLPSGQAVSADPDLVVLAGEDRLVLDRSTVASADVVQDEFRGFAVHLRLTRPAAETFAAITRRNIGRVVQVVFRGRVLVRPIVQEEISDGNLILSGVSPEDAKTIADLLR